MPECTLPVIHRLDSRERVLSLSRQTTATDPNPNPKPDPFGTALKSLASTTDCKNGARNYPNEASHEMTMINVGILLVT